MQYDRQLVLSGAEEQKNWIMTINIAIIAYDGLNEGKWEGDL